MAEDPVVSELRAAAASLTLAAAAAENGDWPAAEQSALDAQSLAACVLREINLKQVPAPPPQVTTASTAS
jgi:hypothetical protein